MLSKTENAYSEILQVKTLLTIIVILVVFISKNKLELVRARAAAEY